MQDSLSSAAGRGRVLSAARPAALPLLCRGRPDGTESPFPRPPHATTRAAAAGEEQNVAPVPQERWGVLAPLPLQ